MKINFLTLTKIEKEKPKILYVYKAYYRVKLLKKRLTSQNKILFSF